MGNRIEEIRRKMQFEDKLFKRRKARVHLSIYIHHEKSIDIRYVFDGKYNHHIDVDDKTAIKLRNDLCELYGNPKEDKHETKVF